MSRQVQFREHLPIAAFVDPLACAAGQCSSACRPAWRTMWSRHQPFRVGLPASAADGKIAARIPLRQRASLWLYHDMSLCHEMEGLKGKGV
jgi:hypothetical protein